MKVEKCEMDDVSFLKRNEESLYFPIIVSLTSKAEIKSQEDLEV